MVRCVSLLRKFKRCRNCVDYNLLPVAMCCPVVPSPLTDVEAGVAVKADVEDGEQASVARGHIMPVQFDSSAAACKSASGNRGGSSLDDPVPGLPLYPRLHIFHVGRLTGRKPVSMRSQLSRGSYMERAGKLASVESAAATPGGEASTASAPAASDSAAAAAARPSLLSVSRSGRVQHLCWR